MSAFGKNGYSAATVRSVSYSGLGGVDFSADGSSVSRGRYAYLENMYRDYEGDGAGIIESIPGYREIANFGGSCHGLYSYKNSSGKDMIVAHIKDRLYEFSLAGIDTDFSKRELHGLSTEGSDAFVNADALYVIDGSSIFKLSENFFDKISDTTGGIHIPTTHINGTYVAQRNLLTRRFREKFLIGSCDTVAYGSEGLRYVITNEEEKLCKVVGTDEAEETKLCIPARTKIGDTYYSVTEIAPRAFQMNGVIEECIIASGVRSIGAMAFYKCPALRTVTLPDSVATLGDSVFADCTALSKLHIGIGMEDVGENTVSTCSSLSQINYAGTSAQFEKISNTESFGSRPISYNAEERSAVIAIPINNPAISVKRVTLDDIDVGYEVITKRGLCTLLKLDLEEKSMAEGKTLVFEGVLSSLPESYEQMGLGGFVTSVYASKTGAINKAILGCKVCASFDGRIFLSGNPEYPGYVFYTCKANESDTDPLYFGEMNYFRDGSGNFAINAMLKTGDSLAIFKEADDGGGSIFYHTPESTNDPIIPKIYPTVYTHCGLAAKGKAISFLDDPVFLSEKGVSAFEKKSVNLERSIVCRSNNINPKLLSENLSEAKMAIWRGYLVISVGGNMYLADSRASFIGKEGNTEYEWYFLSGIGSYFGDKTVYRYKGAAREGYETHPNTDMPAQALVNSYKTEDGYIYYTIEDSVRYEVYPTKEKKGGDFYPATQILAIGDLMLFATGEGKISVFNNDKRGIAPDEIREALDFDASDYAESFGRRIHPFYYSFANHAPRYAVKTVKDNCNLPHLSKSTVKRSLTIKCRAISGGSICCEAGSDRDGYREICRFPNRDLSFGDIDFGAMSLSPNDIYTVSLSEKLKNWVEKQITIYTTEFGSPFGIYSISYRFTVRGNIKNQYNN